MKKLLIVVMALFMMFAVTPDKTRAAGTDMYLAENVWTPVSICGEEQKLIYTMPRDAYVYFDISPTSYTYKGEIITNIALGYKIKSDHVTLSEGYISSSKGPTQTRVHSLKQGDVVELVLEGLNSTDYVYYCEVRVVLEDKAADTPLVENQWYDLHVYSGLSDEYTFIMPSDGVFYVNVQLNDYYNQGKRIDSTSWYLPYKLTIDKEVKQYGEISYSSGLWQSTKYYAKKGTPIKFLAYNTSSGTYVWNYSVKINVETHDDSWETEFNDTKNDASAFSKKTYGTILNADDEDWFSFTPKKHGFVSFKFANEDGVTDYYGWDITIYDDKFTKICDYDLKSSVDTVTFITKKNKPLYIYVRRDYGNGVVGAKYSIEPTFKAANIETENNDTYGDSDKIKVNKVYCGTLCSSSDADYYKFTSNKSGKIKLIFNMEELEEKYGYTVTVLDSKKKVVATTKLRGNGSLKFSTTKGKTYYICVNQNDNYYKWIHSLYKLKVITK